MQALPDYLYILWRRISVAARHRCTWYDRKPVAMIRFGLDCPITANYEVAKSSTNLWHFPMSDSQQIIRLRIYIYCAPGETDEMKFRTVQVYLNDPLISFETHAVVQRTDVS